MGRLRRAGRLMVGLGWEIGPGIFLSYVGLSVTAVVAPLLFALGTRPLIDGIVSGRTGQVRNGAVLAAFAVVIGVVTPAANRWNHTRLRERSIMASQRRVLVLATAAPRLSHFERPEFWDRLQVVRRSSFDLVMGMTLTFVGPIIIGQLLFTTFLLGQLQPVLALVPLIALPAAFTTRKAEDVRREGELRSAEGRRTAQHLFTLTSSAASAKELRVYGLEAELLERHRRVNHDVHRITEAAMFRSVAVTAGGWLLFAGTYVVAIVVVLREAAAGRVTAGDVALTLALATALVTAAGRLTDLAGSAMKALTAADHFAWLEDLAAAATERGAAPPDRLERGIELDHVSFACGDTERAALVDVSVHLPAGAVVAIVGENGAGKTTLVKLLCGMYEPTQGRVLVDGTDLATIDLEAYREKLTAGFQDFMRFELITREAVGVGDVPHMDDATAVRGALAVASAGFADGLPAGIETPLGSAWTGGVDLSGGEWQKLALARSMLRPSPLLMVLDEPTASLDPQTEHALFEQVATASRAHQADGRVTVLISHRFSTVRMADLIVVLDKGTVVDVGGHDELIARGGLYAELYQLQAAAYQ